MSRNPDLIYKLIQFITFKFFEIIKGLYILQEHKILQFKWNTQPISFYTEEYLK